MLVTVRTDGDRGKTDTVYQNYAAGKRVGGKSYHTLYHLCVCVFMCAHMQCFCVQGYMYINI